jgi:Fur family transcriptional regulator, iron response regulator
MHGWSLKDSAGALPTLSQDAARSKNVDTAGAGPGSSRGCPFAELRDRLRCVSLRPTRQRVSLGWLLFGKGDRHVTAESLYEEAVAARVPVSLATVYNTLHQFTEAGLLRQLAADGSKAYFDTNPTQHHHFFVEGDDMLIDLPAERVALGALPEPPEGMEIARVEVIVRLRRKRGSLPQVQRPDFDQD